MFALSFFPFSCFIYLFVALLKVMYAENVHIVFLVDIKKHSLSKRFSKQEVKNLLCVLISNGMLLKRYLGQ